MLRALPPRIIVCYSVFATLVCLYAILTSSDNRPLVGDQCVNKNSITVEARDSKILPQRCDPSRYRMHENNTLLDIRSSEKSSFWNRISSVECKNSADLHNFRPGNPRVHDSLYDGNYSFPTCIYRNICHYKDAWMSLSKLNNQPHPGVLMRRLPSHVAFSSLSACSWFATTETPLEKSDAVTEYYLYDRPTLLVCPFNAQHFGHTLVDTLFGNILTADTYIRENHCAAQHPQILVIDPRVNKADLNSAPMRLLSLLSPLPTSSMDQLTEVSSRTPVCFEEVWAGMGCKWHHSTCIANEDVHTVRNYALKVLNLRGTPVPPLASQCFGYLVLRRTKRILGVATMIARIVATHTTCTLKQVFWEDHSPLDQVRMAASAHFIIGVSSSSTHHFIWLPDWAVLIDIIDPGHAVMFPNNRFAAAAPRVKVLVVGGERHTKDSDIIFGERTFTYTVLEMWQHLCGHFPNFAVGHSCDSAHMVSGGSLNLSLNHLEPDADVRSHYSNLEIG